MKRTLFGLLLMSFGCSCGATSVSQPVAQPTSGGPVGAPSSRDMSPSDLLGAWRNTEHAQSASGSVDFTFEAEPLTNASPADRRHFEFLAGGVLRAVWRRDAEDHRVAEGRYEIEGNRVTLRYATEYHRLTREVFEFVSRSGSTLVLRGVETPSQEPNGIHPAPALGCAASEYTIRRCSPIDAIDTMCAPLPTGCSGCGCFEFQACQTLPSGALVIDETEGCTRQLSDLFCAPGQFRAYTCNGTEPTFECRPLPQGCDDCSCFSSVECTRFATGRIQVGPAPSCP